MWTVSLETSGSVAEEDLRYSHCAFGIVKDGPCEHEALMGAVVVGMTSTPYPWLIACDANMEPEIFAKGKWYEASVG